MNDNAYLNKLRAQWEQVQADWQKATGAAKEEMADARIEQQMKDLEGKFQAAGDMTESKLKEWGAEAEATMHKLKSAFHKKQLGS